MKFRGIHRADTSPVCYTMPMIYVTADHGGVKKKAMFVAWLRRQGYRVTDLGPTAVKPSDDYPRWATLLARRVQRSPGSLGIGLCRSGVGMAMVANKFSGIRAVQAWSPAVAAQSRRDEKTNVLSLAADYHPLTELKSIVRRWLETRYRPARRSQRRLRQVAKIEHGG